MTTSVLRPYSPWAMSCFHPLIIINKGVNIKVTLDSGSLPLPHTVSNGSAAARPRATTIHKEHKHKFKAISMWTIWSLRKISKGSLKDCVCVCDIYGYVYLQCFCREIIKLNYWQIPVSDTSNVSPLCRKIIHLIYFGFYWFYNESGNGRNY